MICSARSFHHSAPATLLLSPHDAKLLDRALGGGLVGDLLAKLVTGDVVPTGLQPGALRIRYQADGSSLLRRDFRVDKAVWFQLGQIARTYGVSRCLLFVTLLRAHVEKMPEFRRVVAGARWLLTEILHVARYRRITRLVRRETGPPKRNFG